MESEVRWLPRRHRGWNSKTNYTILLFSINAFKLALLSLYPWSPHFLFRHDVKKGRVALKQ